MGGPYKLGSVPSTLKPPPMQHHAKSPFLWMKVMWSIGISPNQKISELGMQTVCCFLQKSLHSI